MEESEEGSEEVSLPTQQEPFSIPVHSLIESCQASHGLRHEDYRQYHAYCTRRLSRLRHAQPVRKDLVHSANYVSGEKMRRHAYCPRKQTPEAVIHHENFLLVLLLGAERAWAHSCEIKAHVGTTSKNQQPRGLTAEHEKSRSSPGKIRQHSLRRLKRAQQLATLLEQVAQEYGDERTILETQAYAGWMRGNWSLEIGDWKTACEEYGSAMAICRTLSQASEDNLENLELRDLFSARADNVLQPLLRYCQYELREAGGTVSETPELAQESTSQTSAKQQPRADGSISFRGHDVAVENKNLRVLLIKVEGLVADLESHSENEDKFLSLLSSYDDAIAIVTADLKNYQSMKSGPAVNAKRFEMESLSGYVKFEKLKLLMKRSEALVDELRLEDDASQKRLEEIAHIYDALLQDARAVCELPGGAAGADNEDDFALEANANVVRIRALRCYYVGRLYAATDKHAEALALLKQASLLASRAAEEIAACEDMDHADEYMDAMDQLSSDIAGATCREQALAYLARSSGGSSSGVVASSRSLLERLDDFDAGKKLADVPPALIPMPCKPTFFDIAWNHVGQFPLDDLQKHIDENEPKESKGLLGWFRS